MTYNPKILYDLQIEKTYKGKEKSIAYAYNIANLTTADLMFGWYRPAIAFLFKKYFNDDCDILNNFCNELNESSDAEVLDMIEKQHLESFNCDKSDNTLKAAKAFMSYLNVILSEGNCTPIGKNPGGRPASSPEGFELEGWDCKLWKLHRIFLGKDSKNEFGKQEYSYYKGSWKDYCNDYYFSDFINAEEKTIIVATGKVLDPEEGNWNYPENIDTLYMLNYFTNASKLIVQRGYRIENRFTGKWTEEHAMKVSKAFKAVGLPEDDDISPDENGLRYSIIGEWEE